MRTSKPEMRSTREAFAETLVELAKDDDRIVALTGDVMYSVGLKPFAERFPTRFYNVGASEGNMMGIAAGFAACGKISFASTFACFATMRACEQVRTDICYPNLNVKIVGTHGGLSIGAGGTTHHATEDIAIMRSLANMTVIVPADAPETCAVVRAAAHHEGPVYIRLGRAPEPVIYQNGEIPFEIGKAIALREGEDVTILATGVMVYESLGAAEILEENGISAGVLDMHTVKPIDAEAVHRAAENAKAIVTVEEHNILGGLGGAVAEVLCGSEHVRLIRIGVPDVYSVIGPVEDLRSEYGLTAKAIAERVKAAFKQ